MTPETGPVLDRFYRVLVEEIRERSPEYLENPFTVAEIYQSLVPYRSHRDRIGIEMNADYEDALLRLLAGEGEYLTIDSRAARQQIREELDSLNPDTGVYRDFAAVEVELNQDMLPDQEADQPASDDGEGHPAETDFREASASAGFSFVDDLEAAGASDAPEGGEDAALAPGGEPEDLPAPEDGSGPGKPEAPTGRDEETADGGVCRWCRGELPDRDELRFCPHCGSRRDRIPCPECGTELATEWRFCIACGTAVDVS